MQIVADYSHVTSHACDTGSQVMSDVHGSCLAYDKQESPCIASI